ncbi:hypothetical protein ZHAS_00006224 [Anopheles sinensis]|uniref:Uncharacterized protein n=1 Tax=Anopheles sinensis TaxID=74873 RepID=A0A084VLF0_ANOSI|nr:hypothetical protein ZHAS_00006224 [Anopheles sinensis]
MRTFLVSSNFHSLELFPRVYFPSANANHRLLLVKVFAACLAVISAVYVQYVSTAYQNSASAGAKVPSFGGIGEGLGEDVGDGVGEEFSEGTGANTATLSLDGAELTPRVGAGALADASPFNSGKPEVYFIKYQGPCPSRMS